MDYIAAIKKRHAVRTFDKDAVIPESAIEEVRQTIEATKSPFGGKIDVKLHHFDLSKETPNTYGSVEGASWWMLVGASPEPESLLTLGFRMEQVALKLFDMGLGTNFITATFKGSSFIPAANFPPETPLTVIMPFGVPKEKFRFTEWLTHLFLRSRKRMPFSKTFPDCPRDSVFHTPLEMMRLAPSAYNRQSWRAHVDGNVVWFYQVPSHNSLIGVGNGLCNFYFSLKQLGHDGDFSKPDGAPGFEGWEPVAKFTLR